MCAGDRIRTHALHGGAFGQRRFGFPLPLDERLNALQVGIGLEVAHRPIHHLLPQVRQTGCQ